MSNQGWACSCWMMEWEKIKELFPKEGELLEESFPDFQDLYDVIDEGSEEEKLFHFHNLVKKFEEETGLNLYIVHVPDDSDGLSPGIYWEVSGVQEFTKAGKRYFNFITYERWVEYG